MENTLKRLLNAETEAEELVENAKNQREQLIQDALHKSHDAEQKQQQSQGKGDCKTANNVLHCILVL